MRVYVNNDLIRTEYCIFLAPILGLPSFVIWGEDPKQINDRYQKSRQNHILIKSNAETCDYFVYPTYFRLDDWHELYVYTEQARKHEKKVIVFSYGDIDDYFSVCDNIIRFKRATLKNNHLNEYCLPPFPQDIGTLQNSDYHKSIINEQHDLYTIGYTGYSHYYDIPSRFFYWGTRIVGSIARTSLIKKILLFTKNEYRYGRLVNAGIGNYRRARALHYLTLSKKYGLHFIQRKHALTTTAPETLRSEYIQNLIGCDFPLVVRGFGNYSFRLYEVMSLGKIPVFVDTGVKLPFHEEIPYHDLFIWVPAHDLHNISHYIDNFLKNNSHKLSIIQQNIRSIYESYFIMNEYYNKIISLLKTQ